MNIKPDGFYKWNKRLTYDTKLSKKEMKRNIAMELFSKYHKKYPSHGYKWLNAKIYLDLGLKYSNSYSFQIYNFLGFKSNSKHIKNAYRHDKKEIKSFPHLILKNINPEKPFQIVVSDMTAFYHKKQYYELTLYMDLFNNEIISYGLSKNKGSKKSYYIGLEKFLTQKEHYKDFTTILHTDQGSIYSSKQYNNLLSTQNIIHTMSNPGTPTDNGAMEAINGWIKEELFVDLFLNEYDNIEIGIKNYIHYFNYERPSCTLNYLTPSQFKEKYYLNPSI